MIQKQYQSKRLLLTKSAPDLAPEVCKYFIRNKDFFEQYDVKRADEFFTTEYHERELVTDQKNSDKLVGISFWLMYRGESRIIGMIALTGILFGAFYSAFLSYKLDKDELNKGIMTEALSVIIPIAFDELNLHRLEANIMPSNQASIRVVEKLGFYQEGYSKEYLFINGSWRDHIHMVLINENWNQD